MAGPNLSSLLTPSKTVDFDYPGYEGFSVKLAFLSREELLKIRKKATTTKFDRKTRQPKEEMDEELFLKSYVQGVVKGWKGLKYKFLTDFILVDLEGVEDLGAELEYSDENALVMMKNSNEFDTWVSEMVGDLSNFTKNN
jgi:hypothetical protein